MVGMKKKKKGFALLSKARMREIAGMGGKRAHELGRAHEFTVLEAKEAGKKGGKTRKKDKNVIGNKRRANVS